MTKIYISGHITGEPNYKKQFSDAQKHLESLGYEVFNPVELVPYQENKKWIDYMITDIILLSLCDAIYMLSNWKNSRGAKIEHDLAVGMDIKVIYE